MKTILFLSMICAATAQAQYSSEWSEFDSGGATQQSGVITHAGLLGPWHSQPMQSTDYSIQQGYPMLPIAIQVPDSPFLTIGMVRPGTVRVAWRAAETGYTLQMTDQASEDAVWSDWNGRYQLSGDDYFVDFPATGTSRFYRLAKASEQVASLNPETLQAGSP